MLSGKKIQLALGLGIIAVVVILVMQQYLAMEKYFHPWDGINYYYRVRDAHVALVDGNFTQWWVFFKGSPSDLFFVAHHILFCIFGLSRDAYVTINSAFFLYPAWLKHFFLFVEKYG